MDNAQCLDIIQPRRSGVAVGACPIEGPIVAGDYPMETSHHPSSLLEGFTFLEVMVAMAIIAVALTAILGSQSQSVSLAGESKFTTTASFLAQSKLAELERVKEGDLVSASGDFGDDFPGYAWEILEISSPLPYSENMPSSLRGLDLKISWGNKTPYEYHIRWYRFAP